MSQFRTLTLLTLLLSLVASGSALAWPQGGHSGPGFKHPMADKGGCSPQPFYERVAQVLELSDAQLEQIRILRQNARQQRQQLKQQMEPLRLELRQAGRDGQFNEKAVRSSAQQLAELKTQLMIEQARTRSAIHALLSPQQRELAAKLRDLCAGNCGPRQLCRPSQNDAPAGCGKGFQGRRGCCPPGSSDNSTNPTTD
jgi:protein CpxP